jgi:nitronate monooxygenase
MTVCRTGARTVACARAMRRCRKIRSPSGRIDPEAARRVRERLAPYHEEFGLGPVPEPSDPLPRFDEERLRLALELRPRVASFHFGLPAPDALKRLKQAGIVVLSSATTVAEA